MRDFCILDLWFGKIDANRRAVGVLNHMRRKKEGTHWGGEYMTPVTNTRPEGRQC